MTSRAATPVNVIEGSLVAPSGARFAIVASRFNDFIVDRLVDGAIDGLVRHGVDPKRITVVRVPGSREISIACSKVAQIGKTDAIIALGAVIRGATPHFDHVAAEVSKGTASVALETGVPVVFGVLTTDTIEQAVERAGTKMGNKGFDSAVTAIEMVSLLKALDTNKS
jgi:6,7-dimethyl-8-ribityllumazine synthase